MPQAIIPARQPLPSPADKSTDTPACQKKPLLAPCVQPHFHLPDAPCLYANRTLAASMQIPGRRSLYASEGFFGSSLASATIHNSIIVRLDKCQNLSLRKSANSKINTPAEMLISNNPIHPIFTIQVLKAFLSAA